MVSGRLPELRRRHRERPFTLTYFLLVDYQMKRVLILVFYAVCLLSSGPVLAIELEAICINRANIAALIMKLRQLGIPIEQIKNNNASLTDEELLKLDADSVLLRELREYFDTLTLSAYKLPRYQSVEMQNKSIDEFRMNAYRECFGQSPE